jgi:hypothetical protein
MAYKIGKDISKPAFYNNINININNNINNNTNTNINTEDLLEDPSLKPSEKDYCSVIKKVKKDNITIDNIGEIMLCQIPGISSVTALTIMSKYKNLPNLIKCIQDDPLCLNDICTTDSNGKSRKISKTAISTIVKYLGN